MLEAEDCEIGKDVVEENLAVGVGNCEDVESGGLDD